jgi:hypothetical protein
MADSPIAPGAGLPRWFLVIASLAIVFHFVSVLSGALAAPSGPWPSQDESIMVDPPAFAASLKRTVGPSYLSWLKLNHDYHFQSNQPNPVGVYFEVRLKDEVGKEITTLKFPDAEANALVRSLQQDLARWLISDESMLAPGAEKIGAPKQAPPSLLMWNSEDGRTSTLEKVPEHLIDRDRNILCPSDWSLLLVRSYCRYLCRKHGATSAELIRHIRNPIPPSVLNNNDEDQPEKSEDLVAYYGDLPK